MDQVILVVLLKEFSTHKPHTIYETREPKYFL